MPYIKLPTNTLLSRCLIIFLLAIADRSSAQSVIKLNEVTGIDLVTRCGGLSSDLQVIEVVKERDTWKSYQTRLKKATINGLLNDTARTFIKDVPADMLGHLIDIINRKDTSINMALFKLNNTELTHAIDSMYPGLNAVQRMKMIRTLASKDTLKKALDRVLQAFPMDDKTYYGITVKTRNDKPLTAYALSFANLYYLPWNINKTKNYDPDISTIFSYLCGDTGFSGQQKDFLNERLTTNIYNNYFQTPFNWDNFKTNYPVPYSKLKNTLIPCYFNVNNEWATIRFHSLILPGFVELNTVFKQDDTSSIIGYNNYEAELAAKFKQDNFLFKYVGGIPGIRLVFDIHKMDSNGEAYFKLLKKYYPELNIIDYKRSWLVTVVGKKDVNSTWVILPNNLLILLQYTGAAVGQKGVKLMNVFYDPSAPTYQKNVCVVFDASGNIIKNYGNTDIAVY